jgi:hypothetical protein
MEENDPQDFGRQPQDRDVRVFGLAEKSQSKLLLGDLDAFASMCRLRIV